MKEYQGKIIPGASSKMIIGKVTQKGWQLNGHLLAYVAIAHSSCLLKYAVHGK
jgi:hypothetical protein